MVVSRTDIIQNQSHFLMKFAMYFSGDCDYEHRGNKFSVFIHENEDYDKATWKEDHHLTMWKKKKFYTESSIDRASCTPILKIKFLKNLREYRGHEFEDLSKFCSCKKECQTKKEQKEDGGPSGLKTSTMSIDKTYLIIVLSVAGGLVFFIIVGLALMNLKNRRKFRGP